MSETQQYGPPVNAHTVWELMGGGLDYGTWGQRHVEPRGDGSYQLVNLAHTDTGTWECVHDSEDGSLISGIVARQYEWCGQWIVVLLHTTSSLGFVGKGDNPAAALDMAMSEARSRTGVVAWSR